jgi:hypothetical protein
LEKPQELRPQLEHADSGIAMEMDLDEGLVFDTQFETAVFPSFEEALETVSTEVPEKQLEEVAFPSFEENHETVAVEEPAIEESEFRFEPAFIVDDGTPLLAEQEVTIEVPAKRVETIFAVDDTGPLHKRPILVRGSSSRRASQQPKTVHKKNNGWKRVPKKARLSASEKQRFVSRAFW